MKSHIALISLLATVPAFAAGGEPTKSVTPKTAPTVRAAAGPTGPQSTGLFRIVKPDGATIIAQNIISLSTTTINTINVADTDAFLVSKGKCAFNVKYDEISSTVAKNTTNRLYSNDTLIAQNTKIDLVANVLKTIWTQPYLVPGMNTIRVLINAESKTPSLGLVRVYVTGRCGGEVKAPVQTFAPGTPQWSNLFMAFGYSNYGTTQLKGKRYARYDELAKLNADITTVINAKVVELLTYNSLMARWNYFVNDSAFKAAMKALGTVPTGQK